MLPICSWRASEPFFITWIDQDSFLEVYAFNHVQIDHPAKSRRQIIYHNLILWGMLSGKKHLEFTLCFFFFLWHILLKKTLTASYSVLQSKVLNVFFQRGVRSDLNAFLQTIYKASWHGVADLALFRMFLLPYSEKFFFHPLALVPQSYLLTFLVCLDASRSNYVAMIHQWDDQDLTLRPTLINLVLPSLKF